MSKQRANCIQGEAAPRHSTSRMLAASPLPQTISLAPTENGLMLLKFELKLELLETALACPSVKGLVGTPLGMTWCSWTLGGQAQSRHTEPTCHGSLLRSFASRVGHTLGKL